MIGKDMDLILLNGKDEAFHNLVFFIKRNIDKKWNKANL